MSALLTVEGVTAFYGDSQALYGVSLELGDGEALALMGRNGMGKSTTIGCIAGLIPPRDGCIGFAGRDVTRIPSFRIARMGLGLVPEGRRCFAPLSVRENLIAAARRGYWDMARVSALFPRLRERAGQKAGTLSGGEQQMLTIGRALMTNPRLLVLDEATEGLAPVIREEIWQAIELLKQEGLAILIVDKSLAELSRVADRCVLLEKGRDVWEGRFSELGAEVTGRYLGL